MTDKLTECPYYLISRAALAITSALKRGYTAAGAGRVKPAYLGVLMGLWEKDSQRVVELGRKAGLEPSTMTGLIDRMERDGFVRREPDPADRRALRVRLTARSLNMREAVTAVTDTILEDVLTGITGKDLEAMKGVLKQILRNLDYDVNGG